MKNKVKKEYDQNGNLVWYENNKGEWHQREYNQETNELIFWENQDGVIYSLNEAKLKKKFKIKTNLIIELVVEKTWLPSEDHADVYAEIYNVLTPNGYTEIHDIVRSYVEQGAYYDFQTVDFEMEPDEDGEYYRVWLEIYELDSNIDKYLDDDEPQSIGLFGCVEDAKAWISYLVNMIFKRYEAINLSPRTNLEDLRF